jgi:peptidase M15-like protein
VNLTPDITLEDFDHGGAAVPANLQANAQAMATLLQAYLDTTGIAVIITSGYRTAADNASVGGASDSQHVTASALDFIPRGTTILGFATAMLQAQAQGGLPDFGQLEIDPTNGHLHLSLPNGSHTNDTILRQGDGSYAAWAPDTGPTDPVNFPTMPTPTKAASSALRSRQRSLC